jgi:hypothetical protein
MTDLLPIRALVIDSSGRLRLRAFLSLVVLLVGGALALASLGGRLAVAGIAILEAIAASVLLWAAGRR